MTYAAIVDVQGIAVADSDRALEGRPMPARGDLRTLVAGGSLAMLRAICTPEGQTLELRQPLLMGGAEFGSIRIGVSTLLIRHELGQALRPAIVTGAVALLVATIVALFFAQLILRPIHVIRGGLSRLGRGEFGVRLDLPQQDEFGELGAFFNTVSAQLSADRSELAGQKAKLESAVEHLADAVAIFSPEGELLFAHPAMRATRPPDTLARSIDDVLPADHPYPRLVEETLASGQSRGPVPVGVAVTGPGGGADDHQGGERLVTAHAINDVEKRVMGVMLVARDMQYLSRVQSTINYSRKLAALGRLSAGVAHEVKNPLNAMLIRRCSGRHSSTSR